MDREELIRALFQAHMDNPDLKALCEACLEDKSIDLPRATAELKAALKAIEEAQAANAGASAEEMRAAVAKAVGEGVRAEASRRSAIEGVFKPFAAVAGVAAALADCVADTDITAAQASDRLLTVLGKDAGSVAGTVKVRDNPGQESLIADVSAVLLARSGLADDETRVRAKQSRFHNMSLMELAKASLQRGNVDFSAMNVQQIAMAALTQSTSDFPILLENTMHKALQNAFAITPDTWSRFCDRGSVSDFRAHNRYRLGSLGNYRVVNEAGEYENLPIPDGEKQSISAEDRGMIINVTYKMLVDDDVGAFTRLAADIGRAGARTIETEVYATLALNGGLGPLLSDGLPIFDAAHKNIGTPAALSVDSLDADRVLMGKQMDISQNDFLDLSPAVLLLALEYGGTARVINDAEFDPDATGQLRRPNKVRGLYRDVVDTARLTGTPRYSFADPAQNPVLEVAFLNGESTPQLMMEDSFNTRGLRWRATLDFGVGGVGYRGAVRNAGA